MASETYIGGFHAVIAWLEDNETAPREVLVLDAKHDAKTRRVSALAAERRVTVRTISRQEMDLRAPGLKHQGVLAAVPAQEMKAEDVLDAEAGRDDLVLVLDGVQDPHNLGACIRTAEAAGVCAVVVPKDRAAGLTPVVRKVAAGAAERVPVVGVTNLSRALEKLRDRGYWITGLAGDATDDAGQVAAATELYEIDFTGPVAIVMGSEGEGLRRLTREHCDHLAKIPMQGEIESLNVSVAAAVALYEVVRQRRQAALDKAAKAKARARAVATGAGAGAVGVTAKPKTGKTAAGTGTAASSTTAAKAKASNPLKKAVARRRTPPAGGVQVFELDGRHDD